MKGVLSPSIIDPPSIVIALVQLYLYIYIFMKYNSYILQTRRRRKHKEKIIFFKVRDNMYHRF